MSKHFNEDMIFPIIFISLLLLISIGVSLLNVFISVEVSRILPIIVLSLSVMLAVVIIAFILTILDELYDKEYPDE